MGQGPSTAAVLDEDWHLEVLASALARPAPTTVSPPRSRPRVTAAPRHRCGGLLAHGAVWAVLAAVTMSGLVAVQGMRGRVADQERALRRATGTAEVMRRRIANQSTASSELARRVGALEAAAANRPDQAAVARRVKASVFTVETSTAQGSAFVLAAAGGTSSLVTDFHVVSSTWNAGGRTVSVRQDGTRYSATVVNVSPASDLALLQVRAMFPALGRAAASPSVGDPVLVLGSPLGLGGTVSSGIVSAFRARDTGHLIQFSAPISPGNSGGPVLDASGRVIGVAVSKAISEGAEGLSFAIPIARVCATVFRC